jgi:putative DNA primase/helicase
VRGDADTARAEQRRDQLSQQEEPPTPAIDEGPPPDFGEPAPRDDGSPFQCLGYDHGDYYYLARGAKQVMRLSGAGHTKNSLMMLAPLSHWEREFPTKNGADWDMAANALMRSSERVGVYDPSRVRGRGAWWDDGKPVLHIGDRLIVSGREYGITDVRSRFIYEAAPPLRVNTANPLAISEAVGLVDVCKLLPWEKPIHALLLAGWCVIAPACGALKWRSHIWVTGPAGSGKSWVYENILVRCLGDIALAAASETTEAGLRQVLGTDARPVVFDEAEGENARAQARIQNVLALMRQASSETSAAIYKGTSTGDGVRYITRSCFAFSSIGVGLQQHADQTRVSVLSLTIDQTKTPSQRAAHFSDVLEPLWLRTITPEFVDRLHARTVSLLPVIRKNAETFAVAGASVIGTRRLGDQLGALIAGAYSLHSNKEITLDAARKWLSEQDWTDQTQVQEQRDEVACLSHLLQHVIGIQTERGRADRSMGELVARVARTVIDPLVPGEQAHEALKRHGMRVEGDYLVVANGHTAIGKILANTPWSRNWSRTLVRLPDTMKMTPMRFGGSSPDRSVAIPLGVVFGDERNEPIDGTDPQLDNALDAD